MNWNARYSNDDFSNASPEQGHDFQSNDHGRSIARNMQVVLGLHPSHPLHDLTSIAEKLHGKAIAAHSAAATAHRTNNDRAMMYSGRAVALSEAADDVQTYIELWLYPEHYLKF